MRIFSYIAPPHAPPMLDHQFMIYFVSYLFGVEKMILILHIWVVNNHIERSHQKSLIFTIKAKFRMSHMSYWKLKIAINWMCTHM